MGDCISLYPIFDPGTSPGVVELHPYQLSYVDEDDKTCLLQLVPDEARKNLYFIDDPSNIWLHEDYGFQIERKISIINPSPLFGTGKNAIAAEDATIGIAFQWASKTSMRKLTKKIGVFSCSDRNIGFAISEKFDKCIFNGEVCFTIFLYLATPGNPNGGKRPFANLPGYSLGVIDSTVVQIDGNGSLLPVYYEDVSGAALWHLNCNIEDPAIDSFSNPDIVSIIINRKNSNYKFIDKKSEFYNPQMANEVMASAISLIIESVRASDPGFSKLNNSEHGSVADALRYFRDELNWDLSTPITVNKSIRVAFESKNQ